MQSGDLFKNVPFFRELSEEELDEIRNIAIRRLVRKRSVVFVEGGDKEAVYFIRRGLVKTYKTGENGHEQIISFLGAGDMFPHTGLFNNRPYPATAEAITQAVLLAIPVRDFERLLVRRPEIAVKVLRVMSAKIEELQMKLQHMTGIDVQDRVVRFLLNLAGRHGRETESGIAVRVPLTNRELASAVGTSRETVNRILNQLRKQNILEADRSGFLIKDSGALLALIRTDGRASPPASDFE